MGSQDLSGERQRQNCGLGTEGLTAAGGKSCAVSLLNVSDGHLSWKLLLPSPSCLVALSPRTAQVHQGDVPQRARELPLGSAQASQNGGITSLIPHFDLTVVSWDLCLDLCYPSCSPCYLNVLRCTSFVSKAPLCRTDCGNQLGQRGTNDLQKMVHVDS